ncbi:DUF397 domain-containing protein [Streptomyces sp. NPDC049813]|uniref:DUF397 domain-containing protein n=1 Tax=Streptomyces sp. NPDC049813 TaxID=3365597 RepID=UPI0037B5A0BA
MNVEESAPDAAEPAWFKSSYSSGEGGECVEVGAGSAKIVVRDTKDPARAVMGVTPSAWTAFVGFAGRG